MAVESITLGVARTVGRNRAELEYIIKGSDDDNEAVVSLIGQAPTIYQGLALLDYEVQWEGPGLYRGRADYGPVEIARSDTGETILSIDMSGETIHITSAVAHVATVNLNTLVDARNHEGAINVTEDGPQGVEVLRPAMAFAVTYYKANENVTWNYIQTLYKLVGRINSASVTITAGGIAMNFAEQELRLDGVSANPRGEKDWELVIRFSASPNMTNLPLPGTQAATVNKKGWDYLWIEHGPVEESGGVRTLQPIGAHVEQVHYLGDFTQI